MGVFLAVQSSKKKISETLQSDRLKAYEDVLHIEFDNCNIIKSNNGLLAFIHYVRKDAFYHSSKEQTHIHTKGENIFITLLQGYLWKKKDGKDLIRADQLHGMLNNTTSEEIRNSCNGEYSVVHYNELQNKLTAFNDRLSLEKIYFYNDKTGTTIISNRIRLIKEVIQTSSPDIETLNWLSAIGIIIGNKTSEKSILSLPQGAFLTIQNGKLKIHENHVFMIDAKFNQKLVKTFKQRFPLSLLKNKSSLDHFIDKAIDECVTNIKIPLDKLPNTPLPLSGGKDSRAVLALIYHYNKEMNPNMFSNGFEENADIVVARNISTHYGINLRVNIPKTFAERDKDWIINRMKGHVYQTDGMLGAWDAKGYTAPAGGLALTGHIGEVYRSSYNKSGKLNLSSVETMSKMLNFNRGGLLRPEIVKHYESKFQERISFYLDNGAQPEDVPDLFYSIERIPNVIAELRRTDGYSKRLVNPLYTESLIKLAFYLGGKQRAADRIHFEIINRIDPWLASQPFADDHWDSKLKKYANGTKLPKNQIKTPKGLPRFGSWQHDIKKSEYFREHLLDIFTSFPQSEMWDYCDRRKVEDKFKNNSFRLQTEMISAYGFIDAFFYAHNIQSELKIKKLKNYFP